MRHSIFIWRSTIAVATATMIYAILSLSPSIIKRGLMIENDVVHGRMDTGPREIEEPVHGNQAHSSMALDTTENRKDVTHETVRANSSQFSQTACQDPFLDEFRTQKRFLCFFSNANLGNHMFLFASLYGVAKKLNRTLVLTKDSKLLNLFNLDAVVVDRCVCKLYATLFVEEKHCAFDEKIFQLTDPGNYYVNSNLQSWRYFHFVADDIRSKFKFNDQVQSAALEVLKNVTTNLSTSPQIIVGVHVRRGDIRKNPVIAGLGFRAAPKTYFTKAMGFFRNEYRNAGFVVCSDDMDWVKKYIQGSDVGYVEGNTPEVDMAVLSNCQHSIMSVGTFGWWSAFLAGGQVVYYKHPARNRSFFRRQFSDDFSDYFYPGWLGIE